MRLVRTALPAPGAREPQRPREPQGTRALAEPTSSRRRGRVLRLCLVAAVTALQVATVRVGGAPAAGPALDAVAAGLGLVQGGLLAQRRIATAPTAALVCLAYALQCAALGVLLPAAPWLAVADLLLAGGPARLVALPLTLIAAGGALGAAVRPATAGGLALLIAVTAVVVLGSALVAARRGRRRALVAHREAAVQAATAEQRLGIARDLHDSVGHALSVIAVQSSTARLALGAGDSDAARRALEAVEAGSRQAMREMRLLVSSLRGSGADRVPAPGLADLPSLAEQVRAAGVSVRLTVEPGAQEVPPDVQLAAYRVAQEGLTNVVAHAPGAWAAADVHLDGAAIVVDIQDSGGVAPAPRREHGGAGLIGLRERVEVAGGHLDAGPAAGQGWRLTARLPLDRDRPVASGTQPEAST